jgi:hypothetical protein
MQTATARPLEEEVLVPASHTHDAIARAEQLERENAGLRHDLSSTRVRNSTLLRELTRAASAPMVVGVVVGPDREHDHTVFLSNGIALEHRWNQAEGRFHYVQGARIPGTLAAIVDAVFADDVDAAIPPTMFGGMAVVL